MTMLRCRLVARVLFLCVISPSSRNILTDGFVLPQPPSVYRASRQAPCLGRDSITSSLYGSSNLQEREPDNDTEHDGLVVSHPQEGKELVPKSEKKVSNQKKETTTTTKNVKKQDKQQNDDEVKTMLKNATGNRDRASARARGEAGFQKNPFHNNAPKGEAERRREQWYSQKNDSRRWDSFKDRKPKRSHSKPRSKPSSQNQHSTRHSYKENNASSSNSNGSQNSREPDISANSDHYSLLGISRNATEGEIKKAFRKMALKYHPDKNSDKDAAEVFRRAEEAKTILMDAQSRGEYDRTQFGARRW